MRRSTPINVIVYAPTTETGKQELACRVAQVHADAVMRRVKELQCHHEQKIQLLDAVIATARQQAAKSNNIIRNDVPSLDR